MEFSKTFPWEIVIWAYMTLDISMFQTFQIHLTLKVNVLASTVLHIPTDQYINLPKPTPDSSLAHNSDFPYVNYIWHILRAWYVHSNGKKWL